MLMTPGTVAREERTPITTDQILSGTPAKTRFIHNRCRSTRMGVSLTAPRVTAAHLRTPEGGGKKQSVTKFSLRGACLTALSAVQSPGNLR